MTDKEYRDSYVAAHISNTVASQILMLREARGWTQKELAEKADMAQSRISKLEDPNYENIEVGTLRRLASAFDVGLTVRFAPFSEVATWAAELSTEMLAVSDFANDTVAVSAPVQQATGSGVTITNIHISSFGAYGGTHITEAFARDLSGIRGQSFSFASGTIKLEPIPEPVQPPHMLTFTQHPAELVVNE